MLPALDALPSGGRSSTTRTSKVLSWHAAAPCDGAPPRQRRAATITLGEDALRPWRAISATTGRRVAAITPPYAEVGRRRREPCDRHSRVQIGRDAARVGMLDDRPTAVPKIEVARRTGGRRPASSVEVCCRTCPCRDVQLLASFTRGRRVAAGSAVTGPLGWWVFPCRRPVTFCQVPPIHNLQESPCRR